MFERKVLIDVFAGAVRCVSLCVSLLLVATSTLLFATSSLGGSNCYADGPLKTAAATAKNAMQIPRHVLRLAHARGLADADIKPMGDNWVACSKANDGTDSCTVLCRIESSPVAHIPSMESVISDVRVGDSIVVQEYGQPARTIAFTSEMASRSRDVEVDGVGTLRLVSAGHTTFRCRPRWRHVPVWPDASLPRLINCRDSDVKRPTSCAHTIFVSFRTTSMLMQMNRSL